jgi:hypothetical protein
VLWVGGTAIVQAAFDPVQTLDRLRQGSQFVLAERAGAQLRR